MCEYIPGVATITASAQATALSMVSAAAEDWVFNNSWTLAEEGSREPEIEGKGIRRTRSCMQHRPKRSPAFAMHLSLRREVVVGLQRKGSSGLTILD
jgi:hypothetical protein